MHRSTSARQLRAAVLIVTLGLSLQVICAQQSNKKVRTIEDFPELQTGAVASVPVPRSGNKVRTADDFESAKEATGETSEVSDEADRSREEASRKERDTTRYAFRIPGPDLVKVAAKAGAVFSPRGGKPVKNGGMAAYQMTVHPQIVTSLAQGALMKQIQPSIFWVIKSSSNRFHMFADAKGQPLQLHKGWSVVEVVLKGENYRWLTRPKRGSTSPYFTVELTAYHQGDTIVEIAGIEMEGPPGAQDWTEAFLGAKVVAAP